MGISVKPSGFVRIPGVPPPQLLGRGVLSVGPNPPIAAEVGDLWWRSSSDAALYIWYDDGSSAQWVSVTPGIPTQPPDSSQPGYILFPNPPLFGGQQFTASNGVTYQWDGQVWAALSTFEVPPNTITSDQIFVGGTLFNGNYSGLPTTEKLVTTSNGQQTLLSQDMIQTRYGPIFISGNFPLQISNATGSAVQFSLDVHAVIFNTFWPILSPALQWSATQNATQTVIVPVSTFVNPAGNFSGNFSGTTIKLVAQKVSGPDTGVVTCRAGVVSLTEFA
jgi:hypothetical protein